MTYLEDHPPASPQYRRPRRSPLTGAIVLHDAENATDLELPDAGAEDVARFISTRSDAGSYHTVVDSDSIVRLIPYDWEAFHEGTGGNRWSLGLSLAYGSKRPPTATWWAGALRNAAIEARAMADYVKATTGITVPARRITAEQYRAGLPGFVSHAELDPRRRSDPVGFPWDVFLPLFANTTTTEVPTMPTSPTNPYAAETREALQLLAEHAGYTGTLDPPWFGPKALKALHDLKNAMLDYKAGAAAEADLNNHLTAERDTAVANREAAEAEALELRRQLQEGGRLPALLATLDTAHIQLTDVLGDLADAVAKARA